MTEHGTRTEGRFELAPQEEERLRALLRRSDAFANALDALEGTESAYPDVKAEYVEIIREEHGKAHEEFVAYKREVGVPDRPRKNA